MRKIEPPDVAPVVVRDSEADVVEVVTADELKRRKAEKERAARQQRTGTVYYAEHRILALRPGEVFTVPGYSLDVWWFVQDVHGPGRVVTGCTLIFDQPYQCSFPFEVVHPKAFWQAFEQTEAECAYRRVKSRLGHVKMLEPPRFEAARQAA